MDLKDILGVAAGVASFVSTTLEVQRRISDYQLNARGDRLRARAEELANFLQIQTQLHNGGANKQLIEQAISSTKSELDKVLEELGRLEQGAGAIKVDEMSPIRRWLLLFVPARRFAWLLHFGFYFFVCLMVLTILEFKVVSQYLSATVMIVTFCSYATNAALLRYWAVMENRWAEGFRPTPPLPLWRSLLWYRPASRREMIARVGLLFGFFQFSPLLFHLGPFSASIAPFKEALTIARLSMTIIIFYAWSIAELSLANNPVEMKFPSNLRFLRWPNSRTVWFWMICFYFMAGTTILLIKQIATLNMIQALRYPKASYIGSMINLVLAYLLPMYAVNRILLAESKQRSARL